MDADLDEVLIIKAIMPTSLVQCVALLTNSTQ
jgi:hypothetical protein